MRKGGVTRTVISLTKLYNSSALLSFGLTVKLGNEIALQIERVHTKYGELSGGKNGDGSYYRTREGRTAEGATGTVS